VLFTISQQETRQAALFGRRGPCTAPGLHAVGWTHVLGVWLGVLRALTQGRTIAELDGASFGAVQLEHD